MRLQMNSKTKATKGKNHIKQEIFTYQSLLAEYKIKFSDLTYACPKNESNRQEAIKVAKLISENSYLATFVKEKKKLPVKDLKKVFSICHKTINKYNKYIIAMFLIYAEGFRYMKDYINI